PRHVHREHRPLDAAWDPEGTGAVPGAPGREPCVHDGPLAAHHGSRGSLSAPPAGQRGAHGRPHGPRGPGVPAVPFGRRLRHCLNLAHIRPVATRTRAAVRPTTPSSMTAT